MIYYILRVFIGFYEIFLLFKRSVTRIKSIYQMKYLYVSVINSKRNHCMDKYVLISYVLKMQFNYRYKYFLLWRRNKAYLYLRSKFSTLDLRNQGGSRWNLHVRHGIVLIIFCTTGYNNWTHPKCLLFIQTLVLFLLLYIQSCIFLVL